jgi:hypothetical protein
MMTTPQAILTGFALVALAIASLPYSNGLISPAFAATPQKVQVCDYDGDCIEVTPKGGIRAY